MNPIRVLVVDDQRLFVYGIRMLIESQPDLDLDLVGSAADGAEAVRLVDDLRPDVVLMDIRMPVMDGIEATHRIARSAGGVGGVGGVGGGAVPRVVVLTTFQREEAVFQAMKHDASAFLTKDASPETVLETIRSVHAGGAVVRPAETLGPVREFGVAGPVAHPAHPVHPALAALTPREQEIFLLTAKGLSNSDIAASAFISETTTKTHIRSILSKLGLQSRVQVVVFAYENGLLKL
ncbi:hypothetical protein B7R54_15425 [Subtercola boreus]|uniref:DNA-binding response regulator n=1 Tax=Subtercola boreus TaxID=120213 RepID=A0A3E0VKM1_9MICO|nr:response regulator transcription factor [Subtercola boreus]RFA10436.1 hypothetical protein B7R54_15425 [Subtercola boreus]TQL56037.1 DNA-binding NarL/FixJ family response regulator [Subtercola boreus]